MKRKRSRSQHTGRMALTAHCSGPLLSRLCASGGKMGRMPGERWHSILSLHQCQHHSQQSHGCPLPPFLPISLFPCAAWEYKGKGGGLGGCLASGGQLDMMVRLGKRRRPSLLPLTDLQLPTADAAYKYRLQTGALQVFRTFATCSRLAPAFENGISLLPSLFPAFSTLQTQSSSD